MATNLELYERLKRHLDEETARMLVETLPTGQELATKGDLQALEARLLRRMLTFQVSIWVGFAATIVAVLLGG